MKYSDLKLPEAKTKASAFLLIAMLSIPTFMSIPTPAHAAPDRSDVNYGCCVPGTTICITCKKKGCDPHGPTGPICKYPAVDGGLKVDKFKKFRNDRVYYGKGYSNAGVKNPARATAPRGRASSNNLNRRIR